MKIKALTLQQWNVSALLILFNDVENNHEEGKAFLFRISIKICFSARTFSAVPYISEHVNANSY